MSNCLWSQNDDMVITSSWQKRLDKGVATFEVDVKLWDRTTGAVLGVLNRMEEPVITDPVRGRKGSDE